HPHPGATMEPTSVATGGAFVRRPLPPIDHHGVTRGGPLTHQTLRRLSAYFDSKGHRPSPAMWDALADLAVALEKMADGEAAPKFFLSSLDPGVGKTQTITHFVDALLSNPTYSDVGVLICVGRLDEVKTMVHNMAIPENNLAVLTSDAKLNVLGKAAPD